MPNTRRAQISDLNSIVDFDPVAPSEPARVAYIQKAIKNEECFVYESSNSVCGYGILNYGFFSCGFISLLVVHPQQRRKGIGSELMRYLESQCDTKKVFSSTNESNLPMQALFEKLHYIPSGVIQNLDEGDPELVYFKQLPHPE